MDDPPEWLRDIARLSGTVFLGNDPNTFAIGRLNDQRTWLGLHVEWTEWAVLRIVALLCIEYVENGPQGAGLVLRLEGEFDAGIVQVTFSMGAGVMIQTFTTASQDFAVLGWLGASFLIVLFKFLNFGVSANVTVREVGSTPSRGEVRFE